MPSPRQRLVLCLDGTWNNRNDSTNIVHHFNLVREGEFPAANGEVFLQKKYYDEGVGTGVLDRISGGGFGFGLEENVCEAYDWLVQQYHGGNDTQAADEIYIFGFSRGAYTARSLVGLIGRCGLLRRGAPLSVNQLWHAYCLIGRMREERSTLLERFYGDMKAPFRQINDLISDPWDPEPNQPRCDQFNEAEQLLTTWSRRVKLTYLGVYDTVGALGIDALAVPGLKSKLALHHNMRPTTLVEHCRHALALDENRSSFLHTPFRAYTGHAAPVERQVVGEQYWKAKAADWNQRIEQRWFVGSHSNIGGGYDSNRLTQRPLEWVLEGAQACGLVCEPLLSQPITASLPAPRDSYAEFAPPLWTSMLRAKRLYRRIDPGAEINAVSKRYLLKNPKGPGFTLHSIHETVDDSVARYFSTPRDGETPPEPPPHLVEYARRSGHPKLTGLAQLAPRHPWMGPRWTAHAALVLTATFVAAGFPAALRLFLPGSGQPFTPLQLSLVALAFVIVDWLESWANFNQALHGDGPGRRAFVDTIYWTRAVGVVLAGLGVAFCFWLWGEMGWGAASLDAVEAAGTPFVLKWWPVPVGAFGGVLLVTLLDQAGSRAARALAGSLVGVLGSILLVPIFTSLFFFVGRLTAPMAIDWPGVRTVDGTSTTLAGAVLLLEVAGFCFVQSFSWVGDPFAKANLDSIAKLQWCFTPAHVREYFRRRQAALSCPWVDSDPLHGPAARRLRHIVKEALMRDLFGLIPLYTVGMAFALWFAADTRFGLGWAWPAEEIGGWPIWLLLPLVSAAADGLEDILHLRYLRRHAHGTLDRPSLWLLTLPAAFCTVIKTISFGAGLIASGAVAVVATLKLVSVSTQSGWRTIPALTIAGLTVALLIAIAGGIVATRLEQAFRKSRKA